MPDNKLICPNCSTPVWQQTPNVSSPAAVNPYANDPQASADAAPVLTWGILGLAFSGSFFLSFLGIIFSALGIKAARYYRERKGLAIFGLVVSIMGLGTGLAMLLVYGSMILLVTSEAARGYIK